MNLRSMIFSKVNIASLSALTGLHTFSGLIASIDTFCANITHIASIAVILTVVVYNVLKIIYLRKEKP